MQFARLLIIGGQVSRNAANLSFAVAGLSGAKINSEKGLIEGVAVITQGSLRPGDARELKIDATTLSQIEKAAKTYAGGLKVKLDHEGGAGDIIGSLNNFRIDGDVLRADLQLLKNTPHRAYVLEIAATLADTFGLSVAFSGKSEKKGDEYFARCSEIYSCDLVSEPAANKNGLFSTLTDSPMTSDELKAAINEAVTPLAARLEKLEKKPEPVMPCAADVEKQNLALINAAVEAQAEKIFTQLGKLIGQPAPANPAPSSPAPAPAPAGSVKFEDACRKLIAEGKSRMEATELTRKANPKAHAEYMQRVQSGEVIMF